MNSVNEYLTAVISNAQELMDRQRLTVLPGDLALFMTKDLYEYLRSEFRVMNAPEFPCTYMGLPVQLTYGCGFDWWLGIKHGRVIIPHAGSALE